MDSTLALAAYGAGLASLNAGVQLWEKWSSGRVKVEVSISERWEQQDDGSHAFAPEIVVRSRGRAKTWVAIIGAESQDGRGFDDHDERHVRPLERGQSVSLPVPAGAFGEGDVIVGFAVSSQTDWENRVESEPLEVRAYPD